METLHFAHISDTHLTCQGSSPFMQRVAREVRDPWDNLKDCLCQLQGKALDFVLLTGDLVHEGEEEDYKALKRLLEEKLPGVPLCCAMGNHDHRLAFRRGVLGENTEDTGPYLAYTQVKGLGIITLDSPYLHGTDGTLPPDQLEFLRKSLEQKPPQGNIVILHHPVVGQQPWGPMEAPEEYLELLAKGNVRGVFAGHLHSSFHGWRGGVPHYTAGSLAFGIDMEEHRAVYTDQWCYHLCRMEGDGTVSFWPVALSPSRQVLQVKPMGS